MSFSSEVKEELTRQIPSARHCQIAEVAAIFSTIGRISVSGGKVQLVVNTENVQLARKYYTLLKKAFQLELSLDISEQAATGKNHTYEISIQEEAQVKKVLQALRIMDLEGNMENIGNGVNRILLQQTCCKRAFLRGCYLSAGSMSDPEKSYHFEIVCHEEGKAKQIQELICGFSMDAKIVSRKNHYVVYLKEGEQIVDMLNLMGAHKALLELENVRIIKEMRNSVNRQVNCETANINKTVNAAVKQLEDIRLLQENVGLDNLPENLREMAYVRMEHPEAPLKELGDYFAHPIGKSGVNHRLRKLGELAEEYR